MSLHSPLFSSSATLSMGHEGGCQSGHFTGLDVLSERPRIWIPCKKGVFSCKVFERRLNRLFSDRKKRFNARKMYINIGYWMVKIIPDRPAGLSAGFHATECGCYADFCRVIFACNSGHYQKYVVSKIGQPKKPKEAYPFPTWIFLFSGEWDTVFHERDLKKRSRWIKRRRFRGRRGIISLTPTWTMRQSKPIDVSARPGGAPERGIWCLSHSRKTEFSRTGIVHKERNIRDNKIH
jgi:hypothetical protein